MTSQRAYDYIVVGGGSAGCIVAARLAEGGCGSVLLLEAGQPAQLNPETLTSDGFKYAFANDRVMWDRMSAPQARCGRRSLYMGSGTGMGGSGSVNGMVYTRGDKLDYAQWPQGWQWKQVTPAFEALEQRLGVKPRAATVLTEIAIKAAAHVGFARKDGLNDGKLCGFMGYNDMNYDGAQRRSSYTAFLHEQVLPGLTIETDALVHRILFDERREAVGLEIDIAGRRQTVTVNREIILCAGALETPKLLMLSGIGPPEQLAPLAIPLVLEQPAIGQNLQDHPNVCLFYQGWQKVDFGHPQVYGFGRSNPQSALPEGQADTCFTFMAAPVTLRQSMYRMVPALTLPGKWFYNPLLRGSLRRLIDAAFLLPFVENFVDRIYGVVVILGKPASRGQLRLASADPRDQALIDPRYFDDPEDLETLLQGIDIAKQIASQKRFAGWGNTALVAAGRSDDRQTIERWAKGATMTTFHYCGTCSMGDGDTAPVDTRLRLKGVGKVRVADASVIPEIPVSALNAPTMMIAYRAADFILAEAGKQPASGKAAARSQGKRTGGKTGARPRKTAR